MNPDPKRRRSWPAHLAVGGLLAAALPLVWAAGIEPRRLDETRVDVRIPALPAGWQGAQVAALGDFQIGVWWANIATSRRAIRRLVAARPALALLLGDYLYHPSSNRKEALAQVADLLRPLQGSGIPTYAVLGNHDYGLDDKGTLPPDELAQAVRKTLGALGITVLENQTVELAPPARGAQRAEAPLSLIALGAQSAGEQAVAPALAGVPHGRPRIVMMHNPHSFQALPPGSAPFAVAAHTHGAQIRLPFLPGRSWLARREDAAAHASGWAAAAFGQRDNHLYVNRGIGFSGLPLRFGAPPELTFFRLLRA